jgi:hypothetical protein
MKSEKPEMLKKSNNNWLCKKKLNYDIKFYDSTFYGSVNFHSNVQG